MEEHLFVRWPWLGYVVLFVLGAFFTRQFRAAKRLLDRPLEKRVVEARFGAPTRWYESNTAIVLFLLAVPFTAILMLLVFDWEWLLEGFVLFDLYIGDLVTLLLAGTLPACVNGWWGLGPEERRERSTLPIVNGLTIFFFFTYGHLQWTSSITWIGGLSILALVPLSAWVARPLIEVHGLRKTSQRTWIVAISLYYLLFFWNFVPGGLGFLRVSDPPRTFDRTLQAQLHDLLGLLTVLAFGWVNRRAVDQTMRRDVDLPHPNRISFFGL